MTQVQRVSGTPKYVPSLEGMRGYAFFLVFLVHYFPAFQVGREGGLAFRIWTGFEPIGLLAVPVFFVLSGYLIGGILFNTRNRDGFFKVFYSRRVLRLFPMYFTVLLIIACVEYFLKFPLDFHFWSHFLFIQNLFPDYVMHQHGPVMLIHYWSLATEEQFYLLWPLVVWLFPERRKLFGIGSLFILIICGIRFAAPYFFSYPEQIRYLSLTRVDAIIMGVLLALIRDEPIFDLIKPFAKWIALAGVTALVVWALWNEEAWPKTFLGEQVMIPWVNFTSVAIIIAALEEKSWLERVCSQQWICWLGKRSYSLYVIHFTYARWFWNYAIPHLSRHVPYRLALVVSGAMAFSLSILLSMLSYRFIESPAQHLKERFKYGPVKRGKSSRRLGDETLVKTGA
jgi:peptidoglycan/LPS O-acetylase OafA/YrhL